VVDATGVHVLDSTNKLEHELTHMLGLQWPTTESYGFVKVALGTIFKDKVGMCVRLEMVEKVDKMIVVLKSRMAGKLFNTFIRSKR
jgi:hypothetical protein